jgi:hypothetical protein
MVANLASYNFNMDHQKCGWKNIVGRREVFHGGPLGLKIDNNIKNMPMLMTCCFIKPIALFLLHPVMTGMSEDLS